MRKLFLAVMLLFTATASIAQDIVLKQTIKGSIADAESKESLQGTTITLDGGATTITDSSGTFRFNDVSIGRHTLTVSRIGYEPKTIAEILVTSGKEVVLNITLTEQIRQMQSVTVTTRKSRIKPINEFATASARSFSVEETKRFAAAAFDPARMAQNFAGVSNNGDMQNEIVVRGNSPRGMLWRLEGIEIPNPNHFGQLGGTGGAISMLSSSTLGASDFYTGAFPAEMGNALSGVFDLNLRTGNKDKHEHSFMLGGLGVEAGTEGPFRKGGQSSYLITARYSTLSIMKGFLDNLGGVLPDYQDLSFKFNFPTKKAGTFTVFGLGGLNKAMKDPVKDSTKWTDDDPNFVLEGKGKLGVAGISHQYFLNNHAYIKTIISATTDTYTEKVDTLNPAKEYEQVFRARNEFKNSAIRGTVLYNNKIDARNTLRAGVIASRLQFHFYNQYYDEDDQVLKNLVDAKGNTGFFQAYVQWKYRISNKFTLHSGLHSSFFALNNTSSIEPRAALQFAPNTRQTFTLAAGLHSRPEHLSTYFFETREQGQPAVQPNKEIDLTRAAHAVLGYEHSLNKGWRIKTELYYQHLYDVPVEKDMNGWFSTITTAGFWDLIDKQPLVNEGLGRNYGVDVTVEKPFSNNYYFMLTGSLYKSEYRTFGGDWYNTRYNRNHQLNLVTGKEWKVGRSGNKVIGLNGKLMFSGGMRQPKIDLEKSRDEGKEVYVPKSFFKEQNPAYFRTDIGFSYRINRRQSSHVLMFDLQNVSNRQNLYFSAFNKDKGTVEKVYQMGLFPLINYRIEF